MAKLVHIGWLLQDGHLSWNLCISWNWKFLVKKKEILWNFIFREKTCKIFSFIKKTTK